jgi:hypothetical protein
MVVVDENIHGRITVKYNNQEFMFKPVEEDSKKIAFVFGKTLFRKSSITTDQYPTVESLPDEVVDGVEDSGYSIVSINPTDQ